MFFFRYITKIVNGMISQIFMSRFFWALLVLFIYKYILSHTVMAKSWRFAFFIIQIQLILSYTWISRSISWWHCWWSISVYPWHYCSPSLLKVAKSQISPKIISNVYFGWTLACNLYICWFITLDKSPPAPTNLDKIELFLFF